MKHAAYIKHSKSFWNKLYRLRKDMKREHYDILCDQTWKKVTDSIIPIASATKNVISSPYHGFPRTIVKNIDILPRFSNKRYGF